MSPRPLLVCASPRRTPAPRCHGGASSLLRLSAATQPRAPIAARASGGWRELDDAAAVEHVVRRPLCAPGATLWS